MLKKLLVSLVLLLVPVLAMAGEVALSDVVQALEAPFKKETPAQQRITDFSAEFAQESFISSIRRIQRGAGSVRFRFVAHAAAESPTAQFRWDYRQPDVQEIISDGKTMWVYLPENKQVVESDISRIDEAQGENPVTFLSGLGDLSRDFDILWASEAIDKDGNYHLLLRPHRESQLFHEMEVAVSQAAVADWLARGSAGQQFPILGTRVTDAQGNRTAILFEDIEINRNLDAALFTFNRPADVELITPDQLAF
ncbi:MAG: hypothetical protein C0622_02505 [Desulfuromonas sp.]|nr:MAG: hypothetical protein C0622_02505 [Desulfuromonas sp.]